MTLFQVLNSFYDLKVPRDMEPTNSLALQRDDMVNVVLDPRLYCSGGRLQVQVSHLLLLGIS